MLGASLLLLIAVAVGQRSLFTGNPRSTEIEAGSSAPVEPATAAEPVSTDTTPPVAASPEPSVPFEDPVLVMDPWERYVSNELLGKVLLPEPAQAPAATGGVGSAGFVGPETCAECHPGRYDGFIETSHYQSSQVASADTVMGAFDTPSNQVATRVGRLGYRMDTRTDGLYQTVVVDGRDVHSERMDIVMGSGKIGQSYLYWRDDELFQLPISYLTTPDSWMNSPGYPDGMADFKRPVVGGCLQCHSTWFEARSADLMNHRFLPEDFVLGVTCERCHGPGEEHVAYHRAQPDAMEARHIVHPGRLSNERLTDVCRQCHGGLASPTRAPFSFRPGEALTDYIEPPAGRPGIHTNNQMQQLSLSQCFQQSADMSCITCHNPHQNERGNDALFAVRCQQCHESAEHPLEPTIGATALAENCTRCHMPRSPLLETPLRSSDGVVFPEMVDHHIRTGVSDRDLEERLRGAAGGR